VTHSPAGVGFGSPQYYAVGLVAVLLLGATKAGFGAGAGILGVPVMAVALPTDRVLGVLLPVIIAAAS